MEAALSSVDAAMRVALIVARDFAEPQTIIDVIKAAPEGTHFVVRAGEAYRDPDAPPPEPGKLHKTKPLAGLLDEHWPGSYEIEALDDYFKGDWGDRRSAVREEKIKRECDRVIVFRTPQTKTLDTYAYKEWWHEKTWPNIRTIERGEAPKKKHRKGRSHE